MTNEKQAKHIYGESAGGDRVICSCGAQSHRIAYNASRRLWFRNHKESQKTS